MASRFAQAVADRVLVFDGAMGTSIHKCDCDLERDYLGKENCTEILVRTRPEVIQSIHETFLEAGADVVETDSFGGSPLVLAEFDLQGDAYAPQQGVRRDRAGGLRCARQRRAPSFRRRIHGPGHEAPDAGAHDMGRDARCVHRAGTRADRRRRRRAHRRDVPGHPAGQVRDQRVPRGARSLRQERTDDIPIMASVTIETTGTMLLGTEIAAAAEALRGYPILSLGLNCATGPVEMGEHMRLARAPLGPAHQRDPQRRPAGPRRRPARLPAQA